MSDKIPPSLAALQRYDVGHDGQFRKSMSGQVLMYDDTSVAWSQREAALLAQIESLTRERDKLRNDWNMMTDQALRLGNERDAALAATDAILDECEATMAIAKTTNDTLRAELDAARKDAERWREGERKHLFPEFCAHDDSMPNGVSWYVDDFTHNKGYETAGEAMDASIARTRPNTAAEVTR